MVSYVPRRHILKFGRWRCCCFENSSPSRTAAGRRHDDQIQTSLNMSESNWSQAFQIVDSPASSSQTTTDTFDASVVIQDDLFSNSKIFWHGKTNPTWTSQRWKLGLEEFCLFTFSRRLNDNFSAKIITTK